MTNDSSANRTACHGPFKCKDCGARPREKIKSPHSPPRRCYSDNDTDALFLAGPGGSPRLAI